MASKFALVIANTEYQDASFAKLTAPGRDADEFAQVLRDTECAAFDDVQVLLNEGESKTRRSIARFFAERKRDDLLLLYFSGHGVRNEMGQLFLAANDTEISILEASGIPSDFVTQSMNNSRSQRQLLILDCCNSGAFAHGSKSATGIGKSMGIATAFEGSGFGRVVLTATDATQYAWEGDQVIGNTQKSVFTHFLIEGLKGEADRDGDGRIDVDELYDYAYEEVVRRTPKQTPGKWSYKQQGDIVLRENLKPREIKPAPLPPELLELLAHPNSGVRRAGLQELIGLLDSKHQGLARAVREKLREIAENDDSLILRRSVSDVLKARGYVLEQVIEQSDFYPFQQAPLPAPIEIPKEEHKAELPAQVAEGKIEKPPVVQPRYAPEKKKVLLNPKLRLFVGVASVLIGVPLCIIVGANYSINNLFEFVTVTVTPSLTNSFSTTLTPSPARTHTPSLPTQTFLPPTPTLGIGLAKTGNDGMTLLYVPAGEFTMGSDNGEADEKPAHKVNLDSFWIDQTEVTNNLFSSFVSATGYKTDAEKEPDLIYLGGINYTNSTGADWQHPTGPDSDISNKEKYPVLHVSWNDAVAYCKWAGRRLPTEAEWEKAARGPDANIYPWGSETPNANLLNYNGNIGDTTEVGKYPDGKSAFGVYDMAGNVWEWVNDWYQNSYYATLKDGVSNPQGPATGETRVLRGGSWFYNGSDVRSSNRRNYLAAGFFYYGYGFRCAMSATP